MARDALSQRPQVATRRLPDGASRYDKSGRLWVKADRWMTYERYVAVTHAARHGVVIPPGHRVIVVKSVAKATPSSLAVQPRGKAAVPLHEFVRQQRALQPTG